MYPGALPTMRGMMGGARRAINAGGRWAAVATSPTSASLSAAVTVWVATESVWGKWGRRWRQTASLLSDASSSIALVERKSHHLLHHLMLILIELIDGLVFGDTVPFVGTSWQL